MSSLPGVGDEVLVVGAESAVRGGAYRRMIGDPRFRRLWIAQFVSGIGDWLVIGFLMPLVTTLSGGSAFAVAGILIAKLVPALLFSSVTGVLVDRFDRRKVMIAADLVRAGLTLFLVSTSSLAVIYLVVVLMETASLFFWPARNSLLPYLVDEEDVTAANGLMYTTQQASMLLGLTASGAILAGFEAIVRNLVASGLPIVGSFVGLFAPALLGPRGGVVLNSLTFLFSAAVIASIHVTARPKHAGGEFRLSLLGADVIESFRFLRDHKELRGLLVTVSLAVLGGGAIIPVSQTYVPLHLFGAIPLVDEVEWLSQLLAAPSVFMLVFMALGMVTGALVVPRLERVMRLQLMFAGSVAAFGVALLGFASVDRYWVAGIFTILAGASVAGVSVSGTSYVVHTTEDEIRGRVFTALESVIRVALLLSMVVMAPLSDLLASFIQSLIDTTGLTPESVVMSGPRVTLQISALVVLGAAAYAFSVLEWRTCDAIAEKGSDAAASADDSKGAAGA